MAANGVILQAFHWYSPDDGSFWQSISGRAEDLKKSGFSSLWLPPAYKGLGGSKDVGYGVYDMYDLGEFDQKGSVRTKYGTRDHYLAALASLKKNSLDCYADVVFNHRLGGDEAELVNVTPYAIQSRLYPSGPMRKIKTYTKFTFPGRKNRYSSFQWHWNHFDAVDYDELNPGEHGLIYLMEGHQFDNQVSLENGNYAYLMGCDIDFQNADVRKEITDWGKWYLDTTGADGFRVDAIKHISAWFFPEWLDAMEKHAGKDLFVVGEYWNCDINALLWYIDAVGGRMSVFDVPLHFNFHTAGRQGRSYDMRKLLDGTLMKHNPLRAVTFVENHDSQPLQSLESTVEPWFKPLAYAFILLRGEGYPCVFSADYDGAEYEDRGHDGNRYKISIPTFRKQIDIFLQCRREFCYGITNDYFDHPNTIGWTKLGDREHPGTLAVVMGNGEAGSKWMYTGKADTAYTDRTGAIKDTIVTNGTGWGDFRCEGGSVSVWTEAAPR